MAKLSAENQAPDTADLKTIAKEEFEVSAQAFFAPILGTGLILSRLVRRGGGAGIVKPRSFKERKKKAQSQD